MAIEAINAMSAMDVSSKTQELSFTPQVNNILSFGDIMTQGISQVNEGIQSANVNLEKLATGEKISTHDLMISLEQAKYQLELALEVRNRLVEGYQEIMRMQL